MRNPHTVLGVSPSATPEEIKKAHRDLCKKWHPDMPGGNRERFEEIQRAYESLEKPANTTSKPKPRHPFEDVLWESVRRKWQDTNDAWVYSQYRDAQYQNARYAFIHIEREVELTFEEMCLGCEKSFVVQRRIRCKECLQPCGLCEGKGCFTCSGTGKIHSTTCSTCKGVGSYPKQFKITLTVKSGMHPNSITELKGMGHEGLDGALGSVYVRFKVDQHPVFRRRDLDIHSTETVDVLCALAGGKIRVRTLRGAVEITVPECMPHGHAEKIPLAGIKDGEKNGHHYVKFILKMPKKMTDRQKDLLKKITEPEPKEKVSRYA